MSFDQVTEFLTLGIQSGVVKGIPHRSLALDQFVKLLNIAFREHLSITEVPNHPCCSPVHVPKAACLPSSFSMLACVTCSVLSATCARVCALCPVQQMCKFYRFIVHDPNPDGKSDGGKAKAAVGFLRSPDKMAAKAGRTLSFWCFKPGVALSELKMLGVRSILLTSGTLSPLDSFAYEFQLPFRVRLENPHVISAHQVSVQVVKAGVSGRDLCSTFDQRDNVDYKLELGNSIANFIRVVRLHVPACRLVLLAARSQHQALFLFVVVLVTDSGRRACVLPVVRPAVIVHSLLENARCGQRVVAHLCAEGLRCRVLAGITCCPLLHHCLWDVMWIAYREAAPAGGVQGQYRLLSGHRGVSLAHQGWSGRCAVCCVPRQGQRRPGLCRRRRPWRGHHWHPLPAENGNPSPRCARSWMLLHA